MQLKNLIFAQPLNIHFTYNTTIIFFCNMLVKQSNQNQTTSTHICTHLHCYGSRVFDNKPMCRNDDCRTTPALLFPSKQPDFPVISKVVLINSSPGFLKVFQSFSFEHFLLFHSFSVQSLYLIVFRGVCFFFVKPLNSDQFNQKKGS